MHVAIVTTYPPGKGTLNEYAFHFVRALRTKEEISRITLLVDELPDTASYPAPEESKGPTTIDIVPCWQFNGASNPWRIVQTVRQVKPDVVLFNIQFATFGDKKMPVTLGLMAPWMVRLAGYPSMVLLHNIMETVDLRNAGYAGSALMEKLIRAAGTLTTAILLRADLVALTIPKYVEILRAKYRAPNVLLAPHGSFEASPPMPTFELPAGPRQIMAFGKFGTYKRIEIMVDATELLEQRGYSDLEIVIAGSDSPNAKGYLDEMKARYADMPNLRFTGYVAEEDVPRIFRSATVAVFPYTSTTGSSGVLHQAGSYGCAAALPNIGDFAEVITEEGYVGEFFEPDNAASLADAIARLLDDEEQRKAMGLRNYMASCGLPIADVLDWYLLHFGAIMEKHSKQSRHQPDPNTATQRSAAVVGEIASNAPKSN